MATKQRIPNPTDALITGVNAFDDLADAIANPTPSRPLRNAIGRAGRNYCNYLGTVPQAARSLLGPGFTLGSLLCEPYWTKNNFSAPVEAAPFDGGQCNEMYQVRAGGSADVFNCTGGALLRTTTRALGDIGLPRMGPITSAKLVLQTPTNCGFANYALEFTGPNIGTVVTGNFFSNAAGASARIANGELDFRVVPLDGTDTCGDPTDDIIPGPNPPPAPPAFPPGQEPGVDPDGQPFFFVPPTTPVVPGDDPVDVPPISPPSGGGGGGSPPGPAEPGSPEDGSEPEGEAPEGKEIYAIVIDFLTVPAYAREIEPGLFVSPCRVFLGTDFGLDLDEAGRAMRSGQAVFAETDGLTNWRVSASVGFTVRVTPYYREKAS